MGDEMNRSGLGKGLGALIPRNFDDTLLVDVNERIQQIAISDIIPNPDQPRKTFDEDSLRELADSIQTHGILQPLVVSPSGQAYQIIAGERRWRAAGLAGLKKVPVIVRSAAQLEILEIALVENVQRVDLSPLEQAQSVAFLHEQFNLGFAEIAKKLGKATSTVHNTMRLLSLPEKAKKALTENKISEGHARQILALKNATDQLHLLEEIVKNDLSVRQAENYVSFIKKNQSVSPSSEAAKKQIDEETPTTKRLAQKWGLGVRIKRMAQGGKIEIRFKNDEELEKLLRDFEV